MDRSAVAAAVLLGVLAGGGAVDAQPAPPPRTEPPSIQPRPPAAPGELPPPLSPVQPGTAPAPDSRDPTAPPAAPREPAAPPAPQEFLAPQIPPEEGGLVIPRGDFLTRLLTVLAPLDQGPGWYVISSFSLEGSYDDNIFGTSTNRQADFITRAPLAVGLGYLSERLQVVAGYNTNAEFYADRSELNNVGDEQVVRLEVGYAVTPLFQVRADLAYERTRDSNRVRDETGVTAVETGRNELSVIRLSSAATYEFTPLTSGQASYHFTRSERDADGNQPRSLDEGHTLGFALARDLTAEDRIGLIYDINFFSSEEGTVRDESTTHSFRLGYGRTLGPTTAARLEVGPRFAEDSTDIDVRADLSHGFRLATVTLSYLRAERIVAGLTGSRNEDTVSLSVGFTPIGDFQAGLSSSVSRLSSREEGAEGDVFTYDAGVRVSYPVTSWAAARLGYQFSLQDNGERIIQHIVTIGIDFSYRVRVY